MGVVLYHAIDKSDKVLPANSLRYPMKFIQLVSSFGYIGVFLFFVISGFCIHLQWCRSRSINEQGSVAFGKFWKRRIRRLYPPYFIVLVIFVSLTALSIGFGVSRFSIYDLDRKSVV